MEQEVSQQDGERPRELRLLLETLSTDLLRRLGKEVGEPYCLQFDDRGYDSNYRYFAASAAIPGIAQHLTDDQLVAFLSRFREETKRLSFRGRFYTLGGGLLRLGSEWPSIRQRLVDLDSQHSGSIWATLKAIYTLNVDRGQRWDNYWLAHSLAKELGARNWRTVLTNLELAGVVARSKGDIHIPQELLPLVKEFLSVRKVSLPRLSTPQAEKEFEEVVTREREFGSYLGVLLQERLQETLKFGRDFSSASAIEYLRGLFGPSLFFDHLLALAQQYSLCDAEVVSEGGHRAMHTGFNLAFFGEPGTGKTFATKDMVLENDTQGVPAHGLPGVNRYCGGMTPAMFIAIGEAYAGKKFNFIVTEFNDWQDLRNFCGADTGTPGFYHSLQSWNCKTA